MLVVRKTISIDLSKVISFGDTTGLYNAVTNPTGYTGINKTTSPSADSSLILSELIVRKVDSNTYYKKDLDSNITPASFNISKTLQQSDFLDEGGNQLNLTDGVYEFTYKVLFNVTSVNVPITAASAVGRDILDEPGTSDFNSVLKAGEGQRLRLSFVQNGETYEGVFDPSLTTGSTIDINDVTNNQITLGTIALPQDILVDSGANNRLFVIYFATTYVLVEVDLIKCFLPKIADFDVKDESCLSCDNCYKNRLSRLNEISFARKVYQQQFEDGLYTEANDNIQTALDICKQDCDC